MAAVTETLLDHALSDSSKKAYQKSIDKFSEFCVRELHLNSYFPATTPPVVSFVAHLFQLGYAPSSITTTLSAISYIHKIHEVADPTAAFVIKKLLQGAAKLRPSIDSRAPITQSILYLLVRSAPNVTDCYYHNILISAMFLFAFHAFLRIGEIVVTSANQQNTVLQVHQVTINLTECVVVFYTYKHYQGPPVSLVISANESSEFCPVRYMRLYLSLRGSAPGPLFILPGGSPVTRSFFSEHLNKSLNWAGLSTTIYKGHSFRIGRATSAAMMGVSDEDIQRMGRWKSQAFKKYIRIPMLRLA